MARTYAKVKVSIWGDPDFRLLSDQAQSLYFRLLTSPTLNLCGVADWRPARLAPLTAGMTAETIRQAATELQDTLYVIFDDETEEALVRTFIRHDGTIKTPNVAAAVFKDYAGVASAHLRGVIVHELHRLKADEPDLQGWVKVGDILTNPSINPSVKVSGNPSGKVSPKASCTALPMESVKASDIPQPSTLIPQEPFAAEESAPEASRATRIPEDFHVTDHLRDWATENAPHVDLAVETANFVDYWRSKSGKDATKTKWDLTWYVWMRKAEQRVPNWRKDQIDEQVKAPAPVLASEYTEPDCDDFIPFAQLYNKRDAS